MDGLAIVMCAIIVGLVIEFYIDSRPNSQVNQLAQDIADIIRERKKRGH
jgi:hypothetical protein